MVETYLRWLVKTKLEFRFTQLRVINPELELG